MKEIVATSKYKLNMTSDTSFLGYRTCFVLLMLQSTDTIIRWIPNILEIIIKGWIIICIAKSLLYKCIFEWIEFPVSVDSLVATRVYDIGSCCSIIQFGFSWQKNIKGYIFYQLGANQAFIKGHRVLNNVDVMTWIS